MAGLSLTLTFFEEDDGLAELWRAPALAPAFRRGRLAPRPDRTDDLTATASPPEPAPGTPGSRRGADAACAAADRALTAGAGAGTVLVRAGEDWSDGAGGTSGALWGAALTAAGAVAGDRDTVTYDQLVHAVRQSVEAVQAVVRLGGARPGDKTLVDAAAPFAERLPHDGWAAAARAATRAAEDTARIPARLGRARTHGDRTLGTPDPGAVSFALIVTALTPQEDA
ncbi:DAK2 domain-containing protein [Streptomyces sp. NPDC051684]|uniref:DAK2 domain-containing protein n=1 Tax=Streptomyces sp. NPDC051684 TaxID=3365670 RepID=UPI00379E5CEB